jgi:hypothetical protein
LTRYWVWKLLRLWCRFFRLVAHIAPDEVPALPGCVTQGETLGEIRKNLEEAVELWLEAGQDMNKPAPDDRVLELAI